MISALAKVRQLDKGLVAYAVAPRGQEPFTAIPFNSTKHWEGAE